MPSRKKSTRSQSIKPSASASASASDSTPPAKRPQLRPRRNFASIQLHFIALISFVISFEHMYSQPNKINQGYGGHYQYLSSIVLVLSTAIASLGALEDMNAPRAIRSLKASLLFLATPLSLLSATSLIPYSPFCPTPAPTTSKQALALHLLPPLFLLTDLVRFTPHRFALALFQTYCVFVAFTGGYAAWLWQCWSQNGQLPYPLLETLGPNMIGLVTAGAAVTLAVVSKGLEGFAAAFDRQ